LAARSTFPLRPIIGLFAVYVLIRIIFWFAAEAGGDEAYYWVWGQHPELSYYDHPPLLAWVQGLFAAVFGQSIFVLRLPNLLSSVAIFYVYWLIVRRLYPRSSESYFAVTALTLAASPLLFTFMAQAIMDHLLIALLLGSAYLMIFWLQDTIDGKQPPAWRLYAGAALLGLAAITKYNSVFFAVGIALAVITDPRLRPLLKKAHLYIAALITLLMLSPVLIWNLNNDFQSLRYQLVDRAPSAAGLHFSPEALAGFVLGTLLVISPFLAWMVVRRFFLDGSTPLRERLRVGTQPVYMVVAFWIFVASTLLFLTRSLFDFTLLYWNIPAYLLLIPLAASVLIDEQGNLRRRKLFIGQQVYGVLLAGLVAFNYAILPLDTWSRDGVGERGTRHWYGWKDTASAANDVLPTLGDNPLLLTSDHHLAGVMSFTMNRLDIVAISPRRDQYDIWFSDRDFGGRNALIIYDEWILPSEDLLSRFERIGEVQTVEIRKFGYPIKKMFLLPVYQYRGPPLK